MKTEEPTPRRLRRARQEGDAPVSHALTQALGLLAAVLLAPAALGACAARAAELLRGALSGAPNTAPERTLALDVLSLSVPLLLAVAVTAVAVGLVQTQGVVSAARVAPRFERLDPVAGLLRLLRPERLFTLSRDLLAAVAAGALAWWLLEGHAADVVETTGNPTAMSGVALALGRSLGLGAALIGLVLGLVDLGF